MRQKKLLLNILTIMKIANEVCQLSGHHINIIKSLTSRKLLANFAQQRPKSRSVLEDDAFRSRSLWDQQSMDSKKKKYIKIHSGAIHKFRLCRRR